MRDDVLNKPSRTA